jgi:hypothetical protein
MALVSQRDQARLIRQNTKFAPSKPCVVCGLPTQLASVRCLHCLEKSYLAEELAYTRAWLSEHPGWRIELAHDKHRLTHLVLLRAAVGNQGWCGERVSQLRKTRPLIMAMPLGPFPPEVTKVCNLCLAVYKGMEL